MATIKSHNFFQFPPYTDFDVFSNDNTMHNFTGLGVNIVKAVSQKYGLW